MSWRVRLLVVLGVLAVVALTVGGCSKSTLDPIALEGNWKLEAFGGPTALVPADPTVTTTLVMQNSKFNGNGGVNSYSGTYEAQGNGLEFGKIATTAMAGPENAMNQETKFFEVLNKTKHYDFDGPKLVLSGLGNDTLAVLVKQ